MENRNDTYSDETNPTTGAASSDNSLSQEAALTTPPAPNETIGTLLKHRTIRAYTDQPVDEGELTTILQAALHAPTSSFYQQCTIIHVRNREIREQIHQASGQPYVGGTHGELLIFVAEIRREAGADNAVLGSTSQFLQALADTYLAAQNAVVAAESLGLGTVYLGSINRDARAVIRALNLPKLTMPLVGLLIGHPDQSPRRKPRLPMRFTTVVDTYPQVDQWHEQLADYDAVVSQYYDLRDTSRRIDSFTHQIAVKLGSGGSERADLLAVLHEQGLLLR